MSDELFFGGAKYISAQEAASSSDLTRDYIGRLCRDGKVKGRRIGKNWYVSEPSLKQFLIHREYAATERSQALAESRVREYQAAEAGLVASAVVPEMGKVASATSGNVSKLAHTSTQVSATAEGIKAQFAQALSASEQSPAMRLLDAPSGIANAALNAAHVPVYMLTPAMDLVHKLIALTLAFSLVFGTFSLVDPTYAHYAAEATHEQMLTFADAVQSINAPQIARSASGELAAAASSPSGIFGAIGNAISNSAGAFAKSWNASLDSLASIALPQSLLTSLGLTRGSESGAVSVQIAPYQVPISLPAAPAPAPAAPAPVVAATPMQPQTIINNPVIERIVQTERLVGGSGISEDLLDQKLNELDNSLSSKMYALTSANSTAITQNYNVTSQTNAINNLTDVSINNPTIKGGSISGTSVSATDLGATTLSVSGNTSLGGNVSILGSLSIATSSGGISTGDFLTTNATTTNFFATNASTTNATSTNLFSTLANFTSAIIDNLSATFASISGLTVTDSTTTNATSTNLYTTNLEFVNSSSTNATSTNLFATVASTTNLYATNANLGEALFADATSTNFYADTASSTNLFATNATFGTISSNNFQTNGNGFFSGGLGVGVATTTPGVLQTSGMAWIGGDLVVTGNSTVLGNSTTIGNSSTGSLTINSHIQSDIVPNQNITYDLGSPSFYWRNAYIGNLNVNNISAASTTISGTASDSFTINSDNVSSDQENQQLIFFRGNVVPNALLSWNAATSAKRFEFNQSLFISNQSASTTEPTFTLQSTAGQTANIFNIASSSGSNLFAVNTNGYVGIGSTTPYANLAVQQNYGATNSILFAVSSSTASDGSSATSFFSIKSNGNIGVNNANPNVGLAITSNTRLNDNAVSIQNLQSDEVAATRYLDVNGLERGAIGYGNLNNTGGNPVYRNMFIEYGNINADPDNLGTSLVFQNTHLAGSHILPGQAYTSFRADETGYFTFGTPTVGNALVINTNGHVSVGGMAVGSDVQAFNVNGNSYFSGGISVGTTSPGWKTVDIRNSLGIGNVDFGLGSGVGSALGISMSAASGNANALFQAYTNGGGGAGDIVLQNAAGNVGIGMNPTAKLSVNGTANFSGAITSTATAANILPFASTTALTVSGAAYFPGSGIWNSSGFVGIGTTSPTSLLSLTGNNSGTTLTTLGTPGLQIENSNTTNNNFASLLFRGIGSTGAEFTGSQISGIFTNHTNGSTASDLAFLTMTGGTLAEQMRLTAAGNLGLGTTTPWANLSIQNNYGSTSNTLFAISSSTNSGGTASTNFFSVDSAGNVNAPVATATTTIGGGLNVGNGGLLYTAGNGITSAGTLQVGNLNFDADSGQVNWFDMPVTSASIAGTVESYTANLNSNPMLMIYGISNGAGGVTNLGVGIGSSTAPSAKFSIFGSGTASGETFEVTNSASTTLARILDNGTAYLSGLVGIGTTTPFWALTVASSTGPQLALVDTTGTSNAWTFRSIGNSLYIATSTATATSSVAALAFNPNGAATFGNNLTVNGTFTQTGLTTFTGGFIANASSTITSGLFSMNGGASTTNMTVSSNAYFAGSGIWSATGNLGIGTTTPWANLSLQNNFGSTNTTLFAIASSTNASGSASNTILTVSNAGLLSVGNNGSNIFTVDANSSTTTIANLSLGNLVFDTDAGIVNLSDIPVDSQVAAGTVQSQSIAIGGNPVITAYGEADGAGGTQNLRASIGSTTNPSAKFSIFGQGTGTGETFEVVNSASTTLARILDNGTAYLSGLVGIGTTTPFWALTVASSTGPQLALVDTTGSSFAWTFRSIGNNFYLATSTATATSTVSAFAINQNGFATFANPLSIGGGTGTTTIASGQGFTIGGSQFVLQQGSGFVGIGTTSPTSLLSLTGSNAGTTLTTLGTPALQIENSNTTNNNFASLLFRGISSTGVEFTGSQLASVFTNHTNGSTASDLAFLTMTGGTLAEQMRLTAAGNLGLGTTTPWANLSIQNNFGDTNNTLFAIASSTNSGGTATTNFFTVDSTGNVNAPVTTATTTIGGGLNVGNGGLLYTAGNGITSAGALQIGNLNFDADSGIVNWTDMAVTAASPLGTVESYTANLNNNPMLSIYGISNGTGGVTNLGVAIGSSTAPSAKFSIFGSGTASGETFEVTNSASTTLARILDNGTAYLSGLVGIGTTTPFWALTVASSTGPQLALVDTTGSSFAWTFRSIGNNLYIATSTATATSSISALSINQNGVVTFGNNLTITGASVSSATSTALNFIASGLGAAGAPAYTFAGNLNTGWWSPGSNLLAWSTAGLERMRLDASGNFAIGTTTPFSNFTVQNNFGSTNTNLLLIASSTASNGSAASTLFSVDNQGNVNAPSATATTTIAGGLNVGSGALLYDSNSNVTSIDNLELGALSFPTDGGQMSWADMSVTSNSISGTAESYSAQMNGNPLLTIFGLSNGAGSVTNLGVGVGTTSPDQLFSVGGNIDVAAGFGYMLGDQTILTASSTSGLTLAGIGAGVALLATTTLSGNTIFGFNAVNVATSTRNVTAFGYRALSNLNDCETPSGASHCSLSAFGTGALAANTTGIWNSAFGSSALQANTTGNQNNAFGLAALAANTTGGGNEGIGFQALASNTTGSGNTAIGGQALPNLTGNFGGNVAIGQYAGYYSTSGNSNVFIGAQAGLGQVAVINDSNSVLDTNMTFLGVQSSRDRYGLASTSIMTNSTAVGFSSQVGASNVLALGGLYNNAVNVGIGTSSPYALLSISATTGKTIPSTTLFAISSSTPTATTTLFSVSNTGFFSFDNNAMTYDGTTLGVTNAVAFQFTAGPANSSGGSFTSNGTTNYFRNNVGIGSSTPNSMLSIVNSVTTAAGTPLLTIASTTAGTATSTLLIVTNTGNLGLGTTTPYANLSVQNNFGSTNPILFAVASSTNAAGTAASSFLTVASNGRVGIGLTTPSYALDIKNLVSGGNTPVLELDGNNSLDTDIRLVNTSSGANSWLYGATGAGDSCGTGFRLYNISSATCVMVVTNAGNLAVGTSTSYAKLTVWGADTSTNSAAFNVINSASSTLFTIDNGGDVNIASSTATTTIAGGLNVGNGGLLYTAGSGVTSIASLQTGNFNFDSDAGVVSWADMPVTSTSANGTIESYTASLNANPALTVYSTANGSGGLNTLAVGVGTTSPYATFAVQNNYGLISPLLFTVASSTNSTNSAGTNFFTVANGGNVGIGTTTPFSTLSVGSGNIAAFNGAVCADNGGISKCYGALTAGVVYGDSSSFVASDVAEKYPTKDTTLAPGEIVAVDTSASTTVKRAQSGDTVLGIVSTAPGVVLGDDESTTTKVAIALTGRVPVKVSLADGPIAIGDHLALSTTTPGVAVKALASGPSLGVALDAYNAQIASTASTSSPQGTVMVFVDRQYYFSPDTLAALSAIGGGSTTTSGGSNSSSNPLSGLFAQIAQWLANTGNGIQSVYAAIIHSNEVDTQKLCVGTTCVSQQQFLAMVQAAGAGSSSPSNGSDPSTGSGQAGSPQAPMLSINGNNPATVNVGSTYNDLGATITGPQADVNLGIQVSVDGGATTTPDQISIDTSAAGAHTIQYSATDQNGLIGTAIRVVNVVAPSSNQNSGDASSTDATSTPSGN